MEAWKEFTDESYNLVNKTTELNNNEEDSNNTLISKAGVINIFPFFVHYLELPLQLFRILNMFRS